MLDDGNCARESLFLVFMGSNGVSHFSGQIRGKSVCVYVCVCCLV